MRSFSALATRIGARSDASVTTQEAQKRSIRLYREWLRLAPEAISTFGLDRTSKQFRYLVRRQWDKHRHVTNLNAIDTLTLIGTQQLLECKNIWMQKSHLMKYFDDYDLECRENDVPADFVSQFLSDE